MIENDFLKAIEAAQQLPELKDGEAGSLPDLLSDAVGNLLASRNISAEGKVPGGRELNFEYCSARLMVGQKQTGFVDGAAIFEDVDDSERLKEIMDQSLRGEAVILKKLESFLKDGTMIIWVEWMTPTANKTKKRPNILSIEELLSPSVSSSESTPTTDDSEDDLPMGDD